MKGAISNAVIRRLPRYYRYLDGLLKSGIKKISSKDLGEGMGLTASQIRQDLNCFGGFGQQGYGYNVEYLQSEIGRILGIGNIKNAIIVGLGNLGRALISSPNFEARGFSVVGVFDISPEIVGKEIHGYKVLHFDDVAKICGEYQPEMAILTLAPSAINEVFNKLVSLGIKGFWNFSGDIEADSNKITIENVHMEDSLMALSYLIEDKK